MNYERDCEDAGSEKESSSLLGNWPFCASSLDQDVVLEDRVEEPDLSNHEGNSRRRLTERPLSLHAWSWGMTRMVLQSRTKFAFYVRSCIRGCSEDPFEDIATALFPIPLPRDGLWSGSPGRLGVKRRQSDAVRRVTHLMIMALNFLHGGRTFSDALLTRRRPGPHHLSVYERLAAFVRASGPSSSITVAGCGRKSFQLVARLEELFKFLQRLDLGSVSAYHQGAEGRKVEENDEDELRPYRPLDAARLKLSGTGSWNCSSFLSALLYMPFIEPRINQFVLRPPQEMIPNLQQVDKREVVKLCHVWDKQGLLKIFPRCYGPKEEWGFVKIFNNYKSPTKDRQIGDRRGMNFCEGRIQSASKGLPTSSSLLQLAPVRYVEQLRGSIADRRDFYHQFWTSEQQCPLSPFV